MFRPTYITPHGIKRINEWKVTHAYHFIFLSSPRLTEPSLATVIMSRVASSICDQDQNCSLNPDFHQFKSKQSYLILAFAFVGGALSGKTSKPWMTHPDLCHFTTSSLASPCTSACTCDCVVLPSAVSFPPPDWRLSFKIEISYTSG